MKKLWIILGCILIGGLVVMGLVTKKKSPTANAENPYRFYYYPKLNTYYDFQSGDFVYTLDGGETWLKKKPATSQLPERLSTKVMITGPIPEVWLYNSEHREKYNGINTDYLGRGSETADNRTTVKTEVTQAEDGTNAAAGITNASEASGSDPSTAGNTDAVVLTPEEEWEKEMNEKADQLIKKATKHIIRDVIEVETWDTTETR